MIDEHEAPIPVTQPYRRKLIEVALPLEAINVASAREKSIRHGHPSTLHLWWARRPLAACRAVLFASLVDDPSSDPERFPTTRSQEDERTRLFGIIEELVQWENTTNEEVLGRARAEIMRSTGANPPAILDPFSGGGSIPLEAQRLGLEAHASDLNPVAVLITKALIEIPPKFANLPPVHPDSRRGVGATGAWKGAAGLAEDVRRYGAWMRDEAERRIGNLYPKVKLPREQGGGDATVIAWLWARTVTCPNPACSARMPLVRSFALATKKGKEAWFEPMVDRQAKTVRFEVRTGRGTPPEPPKVGRGASFRCLVCEQIAPDGHVKQEGRAGRMGAQLMAVVAEGNRSRTYLAPTAEQEAIARSAVPEWAPESEMPKNPRWFSPPDYGMTRYGDLFTPRQLVALTTFSDLVEEARERVGADAVAAIEWTGTGGRLADGGEGPRAYADAVATYLAFAVDRSSDFWCTIATWSSQPKNELVGHAFGRQAIPMTWDFGEINPFSGSGGNFLGNLRYTAEALGTVPARPHGFATQGDAAGPRSDSVLGVVSTDPPYYDNIGYADLSDFFYIWLRRSLRDVWPSLFGTMLTPKVPELIATPYRHGGDKRKAEQHFEDGLRRAFGRMRERSNSNYPMTVYYAFKQSDDDEGDGSAVASTGWETMLTSLLDAGYLIDGTWPIRSERTQGLKSGTNALASSIVLVCRQRPAVAGVTDRKGLLAALRSELPKALRDLQHGNIAPVDLQQAAIGPGMAVFSRYARVVEPDGSPMSVRTALSIINQILGEVLSGLDDEFDADTRWAITWFEQRQFKDGPSGEAILLCNAKGTSLDGLVTAGLITAVAGKVRLIARDDLDPSWDPTTDKRLRVWELTQHLVKAELELGDAGAAGLVAKVGGLADTARDLAYRLFAIADAKGWSQEALGYDALVKAWPQITRLASGSPTAGPAQGRLEI